MECITSGREIGVAVGSGVSVGGGSGVAVGAAVSVGSDVEVAGAAVGDGGTAGAQALTEMHRTNTIKAGTIVLFMMLSPSIFKAQGMPA